MSEEAQHEASKHSAPLAAEPAPTPAGTPPPPPHSTDASTAVSQTNIPQMTASCQPAADSGKWCCEVCTYENFPLSRKCTMCRSARPGAGEDILRLQDGARALPPHHASAVDAGVEQVSERLKPLRISSPPAAAAPAPAAAAGASADLKWPCPTCTYENWPKSLKCAMCGAPAPTPSQKSAGVCEVTTVSGSNSVSDIEAAARRNKRRNNNNPDLLWLQACLGVVEGCGRAVEAYLSAGGDPARALTASEVALLNRASAFDAGHTLVHLAIRFQRQDILATLLARISGGGPGLKRSPSYIAPDIAAAIRRHMAASIRHKKGNFPARYINEFTTFSLPAEIEELPAAIQEQLFSELLDREAQQTLEQTPLINWSLELTLRLGSRLYALWNRSAGDCLLDAVSQAALGVFDRNRVLRAALAETLTGCSRLFYPHYTAWEHRSAAALQYACSDSWLHTEWTRLLAAAAQPGTPGSQLHVFALAHVMRRPIIVYGINTINSFRGEPLGYARFQGVYLPLLWDVEFCSKSPLCLGYTRGHFSALVPMEPYSHTHTYICREQQAESSDMTFLPLTDADGKLLPVHFLTADEMGSSEGSEATESILRRWLAVVVTRGGLLACRQTHARPLLVNQMLEEWLNHYRRIAQQTRGPFPPRLQAAEFSSDPDTDDE